MPNQAFEEKPTDAARALVEHLRRNPDESRGDPAALAARFGLEAEFVRRALARLPSPAERAEPARGPSRFVQRAGGAAAFLDGALARAGENPVQFEIASFLAAFAIAASLHFVVPAVALGDALGGIRLRDALGGLLFLVVVAAQMAAFYRRRMTRYAAYGGLVFWVGVAIPYMVRVWLGMRGQSEVDTGLQVFWVGAGLGIAGAIYAAVAAVASLAGGWMRLRKEDREWERLSRQELLERYFELGRRLDRSRGGSVEPALWDGLPFVAAVSARPVLSAGLLGLGIGLVQILLFGVFSGGGKSVDALVVLMTVKTAASWALFVAAGFLSGRSDRGALCGVTYIAGLLAATCLPLAGYGPDTAMALAKQPMTGLSLLGHVLLGTFLGLGATIQRRAAHEMRMQRNDGATLVAEMLEIQWRLEEDATSVTVLVVDAAKSTAMKVGADPLDVEYSFREYQTWIGAVCRGFGGRVHSVAGDGAVVAFPDSASAMGASRRLQTDVARFNESLNRLPKPFRLRLGLHAGRVAGDLNDVQFTEVIDIAAHVEEIAPVGGIAATAAVVSSLGEEGFLPLAREVDGQAVSIALVPTEG